MLKVEDSLSSVSTVHCDLVLSLSISSTIIISFTVGTPTKPTQLVTWNIEKFRGEMKTNVHQVACGNKNDELVGIFEMKAIFLFWFHVGSVYNEIKVRGICDIATPLL